MELVIKGEPVYVKDTGIRVIVLDFNWTRHRSHKGMLVQIHFEDIPSRNAILKCDTFHVRGHRARPCNGLGGQIVQPSNPTPASVDMEAHIKFDDLSDIPYESKAAKTLYKKTK